MTMYQEHQEHQEYQELSSSFRLSPQQRLCWQSPLPAPMIVLDIQGTLDVEHWRQRLETLVAGHEPLRARLRSQPGLRVPLQYIGNTGMVNFATTPPDLAVASPVQKQHQDEPAIQANLVSLGEDRHQLHLRLPALSADRGTLLRLARSLAAPVSQPEHEQGDENTPYSHYTAWLYELQEDGDADQGRRYWERQCPPQWHSRGVVYRQDTGAEAGLAELALPAGSALDRALATFCQATGYSTETVLMTAWATVLRRLSQDVDQDSGATPLGWVHDCRQDYEELADTWGLFSKTLPLPWKAIPGEDFHVALSRMRGYQEEASEWQEYYAIETDPAPAHCRFGFEWGGELAVANEAVSRPQVRVSSLRAPIHSFDLLLVPERNASGGLHFHLWYDTQGYTTQSATVLLEQYQSLLLDALSSPGQALVSLSMHSDTFEATLKQLESSGPWPALGSEDLYPARFSRAAREHRDRPALLDSGNNTDLRYGDLEIRSNQLAHYLRGQGMAAESRVALYLDRSADMVVAILAVLKSGAAFVPLEIRQPAARTLAILEDARPDLIICTSAQPAPSLPGTGTITLDTVELADYPTTAPDVTLEPEQAAYLLFTSGSTGTPKGVVVAHRQLHNYVTSILARVPLQAGEKSAIVTSLAADLSYTLLFTSLLTGGELHLIDRDTTLDPQAWARYQRQHAIEHLKVVPSLLDAWLSHGDVNAVLPTRQLILGGEACKPTLLNTLRDQAPRLQLYNHYGPTEATVGVLMHKAGNPLPPQGLPLSDRLDHTHIYLLDDNLNPVGPGLAGELYIAGANLARGYLCPKQTAERFIRNPFPGHGESDGRLYRSGDLARYLPDGSIELLGRADRQVKIRGYRVELDEIETLLAGLPAVNQAAVVAIPRQQGELQMFAFVTLKPDQQGSLAQLQGQLQDRLPDHMVPTLRLLDSLPLMANGKLDRQNLCQQATKLLNHSGSTPPRTPVEEQLAKLWAEALGLEKVGVDDDFFECGGHSLAAVKLASRLRATLGVPVKVNMIFTAPTVARFAQLLETTGKPSPLVALSTGGDTDKPRLFCFHPSTGHLQDYRHLVELLPHWQLWGLQANDVQQAPESLDALAAHYLAELRQQQPHGPFYLLGWSLGGLLAITVAGLLEQAGEEVGFLGVVDSQPKPAETAQSVEQLLEWAEDEFDSDSRQRLRHLSPAQHQALAGRLDRAEPGEWPFVMLHWARQQGLQLDNDSWQHAEERQHRHAHTQRLIGSFNSPLLRCPVTAWWARDTLAENSTPPADWRKLTRGAVIIRTIDSHHFDILHKADWQQQLCEGLATKHND